MSDKGCIEVRIISFDEEDIIKEIDEIFAQDYDVKFIFDGISKVFTKETTKDEVNKFLEFCRCHDNLVKYKKSIEALESDKKLLEDKVNDFMLNDIEDDHDVIRFFYDLNEIVNRNLDFRGVKIPSSKICGKLRKNYSNVDELRVKYHDLYEEYRRCDSDLEKYIENNGNDDFATMMLIGSNLTNLLWFGCLDRKKLDQYKKVFEKEEKKRIKKKVKKL